MLPSRVRALPLALTALLLLTGAAGAKLTEKEKAVHVLNRLAFGGRPGDLERIQRIGIDAWVERQLHPERIEDDAVEKLLAAYPTLSMSESAIVRTFYVPLLERRRERNRGAAREGNGSDAGVRTGDRERLPAEQRPQRLLEELTAQKIVRAVESERQLNEVMVDFWMNHFNVFAGKGADRFLMTSYERDVIRPRIWGRFEDLLLATAKSPAMLFYLDNAMSVAEEENRPGRLRRNDATRGRGRRGGGPGRGAGMRGQGAGMRGQGQPSGRRRGLNENYAREIMELHTLGVEGGYTQKDVTELARVLTGWSIARPDEGSGFRFRRNQHDSGEKVVLGMRFPAGGGLEEGERAIRMLAKHPSTARHIARSLCIRLVSDDPPGALVDRVAKTFRESGGDLRLTVKAVVTSPEFFDRRTVAAKVKSPFEYVVSAVRALDGRIANPGPLARTIAQMGQPLYRAQPPTGYSDKSEAWVNSGALLSRLNFAIALASGNVPGLTTRIPAADSGKGREETIAALAVAITGGELAESSQKTIHERLAEQKEVQNEPRVAAALILGSPEFQRQ